jgi:RHS repeat-associated protein
MVSALRAFLAQLLSLTLVMANFAPSARGEMPLKKMWRTSGSIGYNGEWPTASSIRNPVHPEYSLLAETNVHSSSHRSPRATQTQMATLPGQSSTPLPDGRFLLVGGDEKQGPVSTAAILDPVSSAITELPSGLLHARAWHSATLLPTGKVFIFGGVGTGGDVVITAEVFDPATKQFADLSPLGLTARAHHTATLMTDGTVFVAGGLDAHNQTLGTVQVWSPQTNSEINIDPQLISPRSDHTATLQADGTVLLWGGKNRVGLTLDYGEVYDPTAQSFRIQNTKPQTGQGVLTVAATIPDDGSESVSLNAVIAIRFSLPILMQSANNNTVTLTGGAQQTNVSVVPAEAGMLLFVTPQDSLSADAEYTVDLNGIVSTTGSSLGEFSFVFRTAAQKGSQNSSSGIVGLPTSAAGVVRPEDSPYLKLPRLQAPAGETAISGQVLLQSGLPLQGVTLRVGSNSTQSDATGRFLVVGVPAGHDVLVIDGRTANTNTVTYGVFEVGVDVKNRQTNDLDYTNWMPVIDTAHAMTISVPTAQETVVTTPLIPGLEFHLPAGSTITDIDGKPANQISITPIPTSQPPFPLPKRVSVPMYFTIQPGGGVISVSNQDGPQGGWLIHPNSGQRKPGTRYHYWNYDPENKGWFVKGGGSVTATESTVVPDSGVVFTSTAGIAVTCAPIPYNGPNCCGPKDGDPVDLGTGLFMYQKTDLYEPDVIPIELTRVYRQSDPIARDFGVGTWHQYDMFVGSSDSNNCSYYDLYLPGFTRIHYTRYSGGTACGANGSPVPVFTCNDCPGEWFGSTLFYGGFTGFYFWEIFRRDGYTFLFPSGNVPNGTIQTLGLIAIIDPNGNTLSITRDQNSYITKITSPNGRYINFSYDAHYNLTQVQDGFGRIVQYSYDPNNCLTQVTDANGGLWKYGYQPGYNGPCFMTTITNPRNITYLTNTYDSNARVIKQVHADSGTYQFNYITDPLSNVIETDMTDPRGNIRKVTFNQPPIYTDGYSTGGSPTTDTLASGTSISQATNYQYDPGSYLLTSSTDVLNRTTSYTYDAAGNVTSVTRLAGTPNAVITSYAYQVYDINSYLENVPEIQTMTRLSSMTDPLGHTTQYTYDPKGNRLSTTDPLGNTTTYLNDSEGRVVSVTDAMGETTKLVYDGPDLVQATDPLGRTTTFSNGLYGTSGGRLETITDPLGHVSQYLYNPLDQLIRTVDQVGSAAAFTYDGDGNPSTIVDPNHGTTQYTYDSMDRLWTRTDPLGNQECYGTFSGGACQATGYDGIGNLVQKTDRRGKLTTFSYDSLNRLAFAGYGTQPGPSYESTVTYTYDTGDRLTNASDSVAGTVTRVFDGLDRLTSETTPAGSVSYTYDAAGNKQTMTVTGQPAVNYTFDSANRLVQLAQGGLAISFNYDAVDRRTTTTLPNGIVTTTGFDNASQLSGKTYSLGSTFLGNLTYAYDLSGERTSVSGNFARVATPSSASTATYNSDNQLTAWGGTPLSYDPNGNMTSDGAHNYVWDARNQLKQIDGGATASFTYDAFGRRFGKTILGTSTGFLYDGDNAVQELSGTTVTANILANTLDEYFARTDAAGVRYFLTDALGGTAALADSGGALQTFYTYEPYGNTTVSGAPTTNSFAYTGREFDATGLYFYRARYYNPILGRFISEDPARYDDNENFFKYASDNPVMYMDPSGLFVEILCERISQYWLGYWRRAKHCRVHAQCDSLDKTFELEGPRPGSRHGNPRADNFDPSRPVNPRIPVQPPKDNHCCNFEKCIAKQFSFYFSNQQALPDYHFINSNSNQFAKDLITSCGGNVNFPFLGGFYGQVQ